MLVVGASRGIGAAVAAHYAATASELLTVARSPCTNGTWVPADVADAAGINAVVGAVGEGPLDALLYTGGTWEAGAFTSAYEFASSSAAETDRVLAVNLLAPIKLVHALLDNLRRGRNPRVLFVGALSGLDNMATPEVANSASKYGLRGAAHALHAALAGTGIGVTVVNPGNVATEEVIDDIARGDFGPQTPIPLADLLAVIDCALNLSPASVASEINLMQLDAG